MLIAHHDAVQPLIALLAGGGILTMVVAFMRRRR